jgi:hypothetical protein
MMTSLHSGTFSGDVQNHRPVRSSYHILHLMPHKKDQPPPDLRHFKPVEKRGDERPGRPAKQPFDGSISLDNCGHFATTGTANISHCYAKRICRIGYISPEYWSNLSDAREK